MADAAVDSPFPFSNLQSSSAKLQASFIAKDEQERLKACKYEQDIRTHLCVCASLNLGLDTQFRVEVLAEMLIGLDVSQWTAIQASRDMLHFQLDLASQPPLSLILSLFHLK